MQTDSLITVNISTIRQINEKLVELNHLREIAVNQSEIISDYKVVCEKQDSLIYKYQIKNISLEQELASTKDVNEQLNKSIKTKNTVIAVLGGVSAASIVTTVLCLFIRK